MFDSGREAKEYLIDRIVSEAELDGTPLSEIERKMMYFTETAWTLPDIYEVNDAFERDYDSEEFEEKMGQLCRRAFTRARQAGEVRIWKEAVRVLKREDHYLLVLLAAAGNPPDSLLLDRVKLVGTAILVIAVMMAVIFLFDSR
jgi:hypothetical protein